MSKRIDPTRIRDIFVRNHAYDVGGLRNINGTTETFVKDMSNFAQHLLEIERQYLANMDKIRKQATQIQCPRGSLGDMWNSVVSNLNSTYDQQREYCDNLESDVFTPIKCSDVSAEKKRMREQFDTCKGASSMYKKRRRAYLLYRKHFVDRTAAKGGTRDQDNEIEDYSSKDDEVELESLSTNVQTTLRKRSSSADASSVVSNLPVETAAATMTIPTQIRRSGSFNFGELISNASNILRKTPKTCEEAARLCVDEWKALVSAHETYGRESTILAANVYDARVFAATTWKDCMRKYVVFRSSLHANNQFDLHQHLISVSEDVDVEADMREQLETMTSPETESGGDAYDFDRIQSPTPEMKRVAELRSPIEKVETSTRTRDSSKSSPDRLASPSRLKHIMSDMLRRAETAVSKFKNDVLSPPKDSAAVSTAKVERGPDEEIL